MQTKILKSLKTGKYYKIIKYDIPHDDYISYAKFYLYNSKTKRSYGNWMGLGWFTRMSTAIQSLRARIKEKLIIV